MPARIRPAVADPANVAATSLNRSVASFLYMAPMSFNTACRC